MQGGTQPHFLTKIFKFQEQLDIKKDSDIGDTLPLDQVDGDRQQRSRMHAGNKDLQDHLLKQIEMKDIKQKVEKLNDLKMGQEMNAEADERLKYEVEYRKAKKVKATVAMKRTWDTQVAVKKNMNLVENIFQ